MQFVQSRDLGFAAEQLVTLNYGQDEGVNRRREAVKRALEDVPGVVDAAASVYVPGRGQDVTGFEAEGPDGRRRATKAYRYDVDADFFGALGIEVLAGRTFSDDFGTDARWAVVVNAAAARHFGYDDPAEAVGQTLRQHDGQPVPNTIIGVVEDFHFNSLHEAVEPLVILPLSARYAAAGRFLTLRVRADDLPATMDAVQARWAELVPGRPYDAQFLDATFAALYEQDRRFGRLFGVFAGLALFVAGLGLFGLATHTVQQRTKEIGIRKALGASVGSLVALLSGGIARLVGVAFVVAVPVAYLGASRWLEGFAYRIDLGAGVFAGAGLVALAVALATVGTQAWRAARADPTRALRSE
jgi:putative ABC transport system permease protein